MKMGPRIENNSRNPRATCSCSPKCTEKYDFDLVVIGNESAGLLAANEADALGAKVAVLDFVNPTARGEKSGFSGSCVSTGCIFKRLFHRAALLGDSINDARYYGWNYEQDISHDWKRLKIAIQNYIKSSRCNISISLAKKKIHYLHGIGWFEDPHTIRATTSDGDKILKARYVLIAVGTRPRYLNIPGAKEFAITSDEIFNLDDPPGKTLIIGSGYNGIELAGILVRLGYEVHVMNRTTISLRKFDQQMVEFVLNEMKDRGVVFLFNCEVQSIDNALPDKIKVNWMDNRENEERTDVFDTVITAVGTIPLTEELKLDKAGVKLASDGERIDTINDQTNVPHIFAIGSVAYGKPEVIRVAERAGILLARRLFGGSKETMDYDLFAATLFTPLEYGFAGLSEEAAISKYGEDNIEVYHQFYKPSEFVLPHRNVADCYMKVVAEKTGDQRILGLHYTGPNAGEIMQGFLCSLQCGFTVTNLLSTIGIHTTNAEEFTKLSITKSSGEDPNPAACCS